MATGFLTGQTGKTLTEMTKDGNATSADILFNKTAYVNGTKISGTYYPSATAHAHTVVIQYDPQGYMMNTGKCKNELARADIQSLGYDYSKCIVVLTGYTSDSNVMIHLRDFSVSKSGILSMYLDSSTVSNSLDSRRQHIPLSLVIYTIE